MRDWGRKNRSPVAQLVEQVTVKLAASVGNNRMISGLSQGNPSEILADNPELALFHVKGSSDRIVKILPKQSLHIGARASAETLHPLSERVILNEVKDLARIKRKSDSSGN